MTRVEIHPSRRISSARCRYRQRLCLNDGIDTVNAMWRGTPGDVDQSVREAIEAAALPAGGYIVGTSDSITEKAFPKTFGTLF